jgi:phage terminase small subunit
MLDHITTAIAKGQENIEILKDAYKRKPMNQISSAIVMQEIVVRDLTKLAKEFEVNPPQEKVEVKEEEAPAAEEQVDESEKKSE